MENPARKIKKICELTLATLFLCGCQSINQEDNKDQIKAGKFFSKFPDKIEMAGIVKKHGKQDAKHCLVHISQMHVSRFDRRNPNSSCMNKNTLEEINNVQNDIYDILLNLKYNYEISEIYQEALYEDEKIWDDKMPGRKLFYFLEYPERLLNEEIEFWKYKVNQDSRGKNKKILEGKLALKDVLKERYPFLAGASYLMADNGLLELRYGERKELYQNGLYGKGSYGDEENNHEEREDFILKLISKNKDEKAVVVFGGAHCWKNNIKRWNRRHKNERFSLIEVVPENYYRIYGRH